MSRQIWPVKIKEESVKKYRCLFILAGLMIFHGAQEKAFGQTLPSNPSLRLPSLFSPAAVDEFSISPMASGGGDFSGGRRTGAIFLNFLFGAGSYSMGDIRGLYLTIFEAGGIALTALPFIFGVAPWSDKDIAYLWGFGIGLLIADVVCNISFPLTYNPPGYTAKLNDIKNWQVAFAPDKDKTVQGKIAFTAHF